LLLRLLLRILALLRTLRICGTQIIGLRLDAIETLGAFTLLGFGWSRLYLYFLHLNRVRQQFVRESNLTL
jgi:hypothetical protein